MNTHGIYVMNYGGPQQRPVRMQRSEAARDPNLYQSVETLLDNARHGIQKFAIEKRRGDLRPDQLAHAQRMHGRCQAEVRYLEWIQAGGPWREQQDSAPAPAFAVGGGTSAPSGSGQPLLPDERQAASDAADLDGWGVPRELNASATREWLRERYPALQFGDARLAAAVAYRRVNPAPVSEVRENVTGPQDEPVREPATADETVQAGTEVPVVEPVFARPASNEEAKTIEVARRLDELGIPRDLGRPAVRALLTERAPDWRVGDRYLTDAIAHRRQTVVVEG